MRAFRIGRIFGIDIRVDYSWVFIFVLLTWNLSSVFSQWHPAWSAPGQVSVAVIASLLFFACVLLHELAHSVVAMRYGLRVRSITLFLFGGVSDIEHEPPSARAEFSTAIAGPITSILLGIGFLVVAAISSAFSMGDAGGALTSAAQLGPVATLLAWLGPINVFIGLFNLIPAFPLDGGRVLRAILWGLTGDLRRATGSVSAVGQAFGWIFIVTGIAMSFGARVPFFGTGFVSGLWLAFIGWFLRGAAQQAQSRLAIDEALAGRTVEELMQRNVISVSPELPLTALVHDYLIRSEERALPVVSDGKFLGLVTFSDVRAVPPADWGTTTVADVMRGAESLAVTAPGRPLAEAFEQLVQKNIGQLPVLQNGRLVGMLRRRDVTRWLELAWRPFMAAHGPTSSTPASEARQYDRREQSIDEASEGSFPASDAPSSTMVHAGPPFRVRR